jgi:hypothetical protein
MLLSGQFSMRSHLFLSRASVLERAPSCAQTAAAICETLISDKFRSGRMFFCRGIGLARLAEMRFHVLSPRQISIRPDVFLSRASVLERAPSCAQTAAAICETLISDKFRSGRMFFLSRDRPGLACGNAIPRSLAATNFDPAGCFFVRA